MPIPSPGTYDQASQATLLAVKAKTDNLPASPASQTNLDVAVSTRATQAQILSDATAFAGASIPAIKSKTDTLPKRAYRMSGVVLIGHGNIANNDNTANAKKQTIRVGNHDAIGTLRIRFSLTVTSGTPTLYGQIYRNGAAVGTARSTTTSASWEEDIVGWTAGDTIELWSYMTGVGYYYIGGVSVLGALYADFALE